MIALIAALSMAAEPVVDALQEELMRNVRELHLEGAPPLYFARYRYMDLSSYSASAEGGHLVREDAMSARSLGVELRVGSPAYDNSGFGGWENGFAFENLPEAPTPYAAQVKAWQLTDRTYKEAVEQYARKAAQFTAPPDYPGDYTLAEPVREDLGQADVQDYAALRQVAERLSAAMVVRPRLDRAEVHLGYEAGAEWILDSAGTRVQIPRSELTIRAIVAVRARDGGWLTDSALWTRRSLADFPDISLLEAEAAALAEGLVRLAAAPALDAEYVGPVRFERDAAHALFRYLLVGQLEGTPSDAPFASFIGSIGSNKEPVRVLRRVLPDGWSAWDDPTQDLSHPAAFTRDAEATLAQRVDLVQNGIVRNLLMSRVPRKDLAASNGHARGQPGRRLEGRVSMMDVRPARAVRARTMHRRAVKLAEVYGRDWYVSVRRLQEPSAMRLFGDERGSTASDLPPPVAVYKVYADGREEPLRGAEFVGVQRWLLRDIAAAGEQIEGSWLTPFSGHELRPYPPVSGMPAWLSAPEVLLREVEIAPMNGSARNRPALPAPDSAKIGL